MALGLPNLSSGAVKATVKDGLEGTTHSVALGVARECIRAALAGLAEVRYEPKSIGVARVSTDDGSDTAPTTTATTS